MKSMFPAIALLFSSFITFAGTQPRTQICDFSGENASKVYTITTAPGVGTTFRLPEGWKITDFVVADPKSFHGESNGTIGIITPLVPNKSTSVSIYTDNDKLFVFNLSTEPDPSGYVDQLVIVQSSNTQLFNQRVRSEVQRVAKDQLEAAEARCNASLDQKSEQLREQLLFTINSNYEFADRHFSITKVSDDGIFTYVRLAQSQDRPVVYIGEAKDQKKLEPVKYSDEGEYYVIHRILPPGKGAFVLKLGNQVSEIQRTR
jgi:type IV secretory pathway VirB9-like protein